MSQPPPGNDRAGDPDGKSVPAPLDTPPPMEPSTLRADDFGSSLNAGAPRKEESSGQPHGLLVVGIGASAGGLEALEQFFSHVPADSGLAYVVVQHLAPQHTSMLAQLLGRRTEMPVADAKDGVRTEADHVYVIAPGTLLGIADGRFQVTFVDAERHSPIDIFLRSLAADRRERAIGIVLSGSGGDGTEGLRAIKEHGGLTLAQTPETAKYDTMPRSAIDAGVIDQVLPPEEMPARLLARSRQVAEGRVRVVTPPAAAASPGASSISDEQLAASLDQICPILQRRTGHDFSHYKRGTVLRRLRRRLQLRQPSSLSEYLDVLEKDTQEPELLAKDLLIGVTQFFRDSDAFEYLGLHVLPHILAASRAGEGVRIWVPGCASGEEAYSFGILLRERLAELSSAPPVQIFATDIDAGAIAEARQARYPADIAQHVSPARLARFFTPDGSSYQVAKEVREMCIFSEHNLIRDPPFLGLDLISCRNLLIYLDAALQKKLFPVFHYALKPGGYLFLGPSESLAEYFELFETVDKRFRVFRRVEPLTRPPVEFPLASRATPRVAPPLPPVSAAPPTQEQAVNAAFERLMLQEYTPPGAVVNARGDVICVAGLTGRYLQPPAGVLTTNILDIAHASLRIELRTALHTAARRGKKVVREDVPVEVNGSQRRLRLTVRPMLGVKLEGLFAVILQERTDGAEAEPAEPAVIGTEGESAIEQLESELRTTRANLHAAIEELESANEELKSSNEEMLSTNEELQSTNEELQSSQEELKSVNEELATVNEELVRKVDELGRTNNDLQNLFSSTDVATLFLDREQRVTRFTPAAKALFRLIEADAGRPLADLAPRFADQDLATDVREVLRTLRSVEREVETVDRKAWYLLRILPYRTVENVIAGAVVTLADITHIKDAGKELRASEEKYRTLFESIDEGFCVIEVLFDDDNRIDYRFLETNPAFEKHTGIAHAVGRRMREIAPAHEEHWFQIYAQVALTGEPRRFENPAVALGRYYDVYAFRVGPPAQRRVAILFTDITARRQAEKEREQLLQELSEALKNAEARGNLLDAMLEHIPLGITLADAPDVTIRRVSRYGRELIARSSEELTGIPADRHPEVWHMFHADGVTPATADELPLTRATMKGELVHGEEWVIARQDGVKIPILCTAAPIRDGAGQIIGGVIGWQDITERKRTEEALQANAQLAEANQRKNAFLNMLSHELRNPLAPIRNSLFILKRAAPGSEQTLQALAVIDRQVEHMTRLVEDLLEVTRITNSKVRLQRERLDLDELVKRTVEDHRGVFIESDVALELRPAPAAVWVNGDRTRLAQAVGNLLQNAVKFTPRGGKATVSVEADASHGQAILRVADTGQGIEPKTLSHLFEPFVQADTTLDRSQGGLGLGLALVKGVVEMHGGSVQAASDGSDKGTTFTVRLPLDETDGPNEELPPRTGLTTVSRRVLIIEDNIDGADSLREVLTLGGHAVAVAYTGPEGLEKARAYRPEVVICDIGLPGMDGYEVARTLRADPELGHVRLVALTGYAGPEDVAKARAAGFDAHLAKPPSIEGVERVLAEGGGDNVYPSGVEPTPTR